jgi:hypothetical protein
VSGKGASTHAITINDADPTALGVLAKIRRRDVTGSWFSPLSADDEE